MSLSETIDACRQLAPDFRVGDEMHRLGPVVFARATVNGQPHELLMLIEGGLSAEVALERVASMALEGLQRMRARGALR